jgi:hypothetical protein
VLLLDLLLRIVFAIIPIRIDPPPPPAVTFEHDVRPILEHRCTPCHFEGGRMYAHLPFDKAETIDKLGEKLFTRIKREEEQKVIRAYLATARAKRE